MALPDALHHLLTFPELALSALGALPTALHTARPAAGGFSLVEHAHHLADLEVEGFATRLERLLAEHEPALPDFDGARIAVERQYAMRDAGSGIERFLAARQGALRRFAELPESAWERAGTQEGLGRVTVAQLPSRMLAHDCAHAEELVQLLEELQADAPVLPLLRAFRAPGGPCRKAA
jgi:hypothetical protein